MTINLLSVIMSFVEMKKLDQYITGILVRNLVMALLSLSALFIFQSIFGDLYDHHYTANQILIYHAMNLPKIAVEMAPPAVLMATVLTLSGLSRTHELVACYSIGFGLKRIMTLILGIVMVVSGILLIMQDRILPPVWKERTNYFRREMQHHPDFLLDIKRDKIWYRSKNMIYNLQRFDGRSNSIIGMSVYTFDDDFNLIQVIDAERGEYTQKGWKLTAGTITLFNPNDPFPLTKTFSEKIVFIPETPKDFQEIEKEVDGLKLKELYHYIGRMRDAGADTKAFEVKFHSRISLSFIPLVMCFLAIPFSIGNRRSGGIAKDLALCLIVTFFYWLFYSVGLSLGTNGALPPWLAAWLPSTIFVVLAATLVSKKT